MTTHQLHLAGKVDSGRCPFCELDEDEDAEHLFYRCPAWASQRTKHLHTPVVDTSGWAPVTRTCASVTTPVTSHTHAGWLPPPAGVERRGHLTPTHAPLELDGVAVVYTDGSGSHATAARHLRTAGYGTFWGHDHNWNVGAPITGPWQSAQRGELTAVLSALAASRALPLVVRTDSKPIL